MSDPVKPRTKSGRAAPHADGARSVPEFLMRPARGEDILPYTAFLADPAVTVWLDDSAQVPVPPTRVEAIMLRDAWCLWSLESEGRFIGVTSLYEPDLSRGVARFSIVIGDRAFWGRGLGTAITREVVAHGFDALGLRKINSDYLEPHAASKAIHAHVGFVEEGCMRADSWRRGAWVDRIVLSVLADEWRGRRS